MISKHTCVNSGEFEATRSSIDRPGYGRASDGADREDGHAYSDSRADIVHISHMDRWYGQEPDEHPG